MSRIKSSDAYITAGLVDDAIATCTHRIAEMSGSDNPQVVRMAEIARAELEVLRAVQWSLQGNHVNLRIQSK